MNSQVSIPHSANEHVEVALDDQAKSIEGHFDADVLTFTGQLTYGVDDLLRKEIESRTEKRNRLCIILTTTGGFIEVVHRIVDLTRHHYAEVDFIIPNYAYSAGTVLAMSGDRIWMDYYSRLGPIDPQVEVEGRLVPATGYLVQYARLIDKAKAGSLTTEEAQLMITGFDQAELYLYEQARELSVSLLKQWLAKYKFKNWQITETEKRQVTKEMREERAEEIARALNDTDRWHSHGHGISMEVLTQDIKLKIDDFGYDQSHSRSIHAYFDLFDDYRRKLGAESAVHRIQQFQTIIV